MIRKLARSQAKWFTKLITSNPLSYSSARAKAATSKAKSISTSRQATSTSSSWNWLRMSSATFIPTSFTSRKQNKRRGKAKKTRTNLKRFDLYLI